MIPGKCWAHRRYLTNADPFHIFLPYPLENVYLAEAPEEPATLKSAAFGSRGHYPTTFRSTCDSVLSPHLKTPHGSLPLVCLVSDHNTGFSIG